MDRSFNIKVDENNRVVIVTKKHICEDVCNKLCKSDIDFQYTDSLIADKIVAVARCHPDDVFDVEKGKEIAIEKYKRKYKRECIKALNKVFSRKIKECELINQFIEKYMD